MSCRSCKNETIEFLNLGHHPPSDAFLSKEQLREPEVYYPLTVHFCPKCELVQLGYTVDPNVLFTNKYPYLTGSNKDGVVHFNELADTITERFHPKYVVDIGSNDGTLLKGFQRNGAGVLGYEPCANIAQLAGEDGVPTMCTFFSSRILSQKPKVGADVITACNVFAHIHNINEVCYTVSKLLAPKGVFVIESPYLLDMIDNLEYDTIYHEHLFYWSYSSLTRLLGKYDLEVFDLEKKDVHGGTMRYYISHRGMQDRVRYHVKTVFEKEKCVNIDYLLDFERRVKAHKHDLRTLLRRIKYKGKKIMGVSAPAKGNTLLNYCGIGTDTLEYITEINFQKVGTFSPGVHVPVIHENAATKCDYALLLAWNWKDQIIGNMGEYINSGGRFIIPIPEPTIEPIGSGVWAGYEL